METELFVQEKSSIDLRDEEAAKGAAELHFVKQDSRESGCSRWTPRGCRGSLAAGSCGGFATASARL